MNGGCGMKGDNMKDLTKSAITLPWAMSMFAMQQLANMVTPPPAGRASGTSAAFDAVSREAEAHLDGWLKRAYEMGDSVQRNMIDMMTMQPPSIDASSFMRMMSEMQGGPAFQVGINYVLPPIAWLSTFMVSPADSPAVQQEFANKLYVIQLVAQAEAQMNLDPATHVPVPELVSRAERFATFPRLWAIEGIGNYYAERAWDRFAGRDPQDLLTDASTAALPAYSLTMLHAGIGMSFANRLLRTLEPGSPPEQVRATIVRFATLCRRSSRPGYTGAAYESLGLATRTLYPNLVAVIDRELPATEPELVGYFWHGVGRALYFDPTTLLPAFNAPWRAVARIASDSPHETAYLNSISGLSWAITVVNMRHPQVMSTFLRHHAATLSRSTAFSDGVTSSTLMRLDTTPDDQHVNPFLHYEPTGEDASVRNAWTTMITGPAEVALAESYPVLKREKRLEELFHFRSVAATGPAIQV